MISNLEIINRAMTGPICTERDFDLKYLVPVVRSLVKKYDIKFDPNNPVPGDIDLVDRAWQAGRELFLTIGVYCVDTERIIKFESLELDQALAHAPKNLILGTGQQAKRLPVRRPESDTPPFFSLGACGTGVTSEDIFLSLVQAYSEIPYTDVVASPSLTQYNGMPVIAGSPLEIEASIRTINMTREGTRRAGRAGLGIANTVATAVRAQGHISGNAVVAGQFDLMEIGHLAEMKIDYDNLSKITYMQSCGRPILGATGPVIGGYFGGAEGVAVALVGYHFFAMLVQRASVHHMYPQHFKLQTTTTRDALWARSLALQAITKHSNLPCLETGTFGAGPATETSLYETAAYTICSVVSGGSVEAAPTARGTHPDYLSPIEPLFAAEVGHSVVGMSRLEANNILVKLLEKYENLLLNPPLGKKYQDCFDIITRQPKDEALKCYKMARRELRDMGLDYIYPSFYS